jgi:hypothetical protein
MTQQDTQRILNKIFSGSENNKTYYDKIVRLHHDFMKEYGWIHPDVFYSLPLEFVNNMAELINYDRKQEAKQYKKIKKR